MIRYDFKSTTDICGGLADHASAFCVVQNSDGAVIRQIDAAVTDTLAPHQDDIEMPGGANLVE